MNKQLYDPSKDILCFTTICGKAAHLANDRCRVLEMV